ncbi:MAG: D-glycero-beta-D-manno-heptose 1-phosphate adenylyltransferase [Cyclobacteriaceae bacterium]|nr:D-glycero-beta-D-manno-heptose 1-phosphate adenylyltransferase [Cyclobacteriaceae bacterium]
MFNTTNKIFSLDNAIEMSLKWREEGHKTVFTNGCFDLVHLGHVDYLEKAANLGDHLILGLNTDDSISRLKGPSRPVADQHSRARVMAGFAFISMVVLFDEDTPYELISQLKPDILVKGDDYLADNIVGADIVRENGGEVITIPLVEGYSTSKIINKIINDKTNII